ncbi:MAG: sugar transferase [bacterium]|nr:sugar transferase [bacterium]
MKRSELTISALLVPLDYVALLAAAVVAYRVRFEQLEELRPVIFTLPFGEFFRIAAAVALAWIAIFALTGLYAATARRNWRSEFLRIVLGSSTGFALILAAIFFSRDLFASRFIVLASWLFAIAFVAFLRLIARGVERVLFAHGIGVHRIALIGSGRAADALAAAFADRPSLGFRIVERFSAFPNHDAETTITALWRKRKVDEVIDATTPPDPARLQHLIVFCNDHHIPIRFAADLLAASTTRVSVETFAGVPLVEIKRTPLEGWGRIAKRAFDIIGALLLLVITSPLLLAIALAIRCTSRGSVLFRQERIGQAERPFTFLKFRSMRAGAHAEWATLRAASDRNGPVPKIKHDPRVTPVGRILRRWSLDELPQLFNVLAGTMSLVGPRPHLPEEVADYEHRHRRVLALRPGLTGIAQVSGRADLDFEDEVKLDTFYIEHWTLGRDLVILLRTPFAVARARGAY